MSQLELLKRSVKRCGASGAASTILPTAEELDRDDPLARKREEFALPGETIYLDGNSLGPLPYAAQQRAREVVDEQWGRDLISSWNKHHWIDLPESVGEKIAPLLGAGPGQVICCDSISVNLFKLIAAALALNPGRHKIVSQRDNFPTDLYVAQGLQQLLGQQRCMLVEVEEDQVAGALDEEVAILLLTQVNFRSGFTHDIQHLTRLAHESGALVIWDLAHSAGVLPLQLDDWQVDFAVGCGYKYLNGGPGAPAFVYVATQHQGALQQPLAGWMGHQSPFEFSPEYHPAAGVRQFLAGTPPVLSMSVLDAALGLFEDVSMQQIHRKALGLADFFAALLMQNPVLDSLELVSPLDHAVRGGQLAYKHADAYAICQALGAQGVIADFRAPDILRVGFSPLFLRYQDVAQAVDKLGHVMAKALYRAEQFNRKSKVT